MRYRQWKKNYKKIHGINPPAIIDKRKRKKIEKKMLDKINSIDFETMVSKAAQALTDGIANVMRSLGKGMDAAGTACKNVADNIQKVEIKGHTIDWEVKSVVCDYGVYEKDGLTGRSTLKLITNSRRAAEKIVEIMKQDQMEHIKLNEPERIQRKTDAADAMLYGLRAKTAYCEHPECESCSFPQCAKEFVDKCKKEEREGKRCTREETGQQEKRE